MATSGNFSTSNQFIVYNITAAEGAYSIENNTSPLTVSVFFWRTNAWEGATYGTGTLYCRINGTLYSQAVTPYDEITRNGITLFEKTVTVPHNADGSKTVEISAWITHDVLSSSEQGFSVGLATIPRASTPSFSAASVAIGSAVTIYTNRLAAAFTHTVQYTWKGSTGTVATGVGESVAWTVPTSFLSAIPNDTGGKVTITLLTYNGSTLVGSKTAELAVTLPANSAPAFGDFTAADVNSVTVAVTGNSALLVQGYSRLRITIPAGSRATSPSGANIVKYLAYCGNRSAEAAWSSSSAVTLDLGEVNSGSISVAAVDSRGQQTVVQKLLTLIPYTPPVLRSASLVRQNGVGEETTLTFRAGIFTDPIGKTTNAVKSVSYTWQEGSTVTAGATAIPAGTSWSGLLLGDTDAGFSPSKSFTLVLSITDAVTTTRHTLPLNSGVPVMDAYRKGTTSGLGVNKRWAQGGLDVSGMIYMDDEALSALFAPAGHGLGGTGVWVTNLDTLVDTGVYSFVHDAVGNPYPGYGGVVEVAAGFPIIKQTVCMSWNNIRLERMMRVDHDETTYGEWEWITPPMGIGVEYRTTERINGKPVYTRLLQFDAINGNELYFDPGYYFGGEGFVRISGKVYSASGAYPIPSSAVSFDITANGYRLHGADKDITGCTAVFALYYTK